MSAFINSQPEEQLAQHASHHHSNHLYTAAERRLQTCQGREPHLWEEEAGGGVNSTVHDVLHLAHSARKGQRLAVCGHQVGGVPLAPVLGGAELRIR